ncbi:hypothetical protein PENSPDRAFT_213308 [Peniophora sp. CONT]|nr:hypothetical protein PENSPDRAFT_213308 [Peniophora sp. CONT]
MNALAQPSHIVPSQRGPSVFGPHQQPLYLGPPSPPYQSMQTSAHPPYGPVASGPQIHYGQPDAMHVRASRAMNDSHAMTPPNTHPFGPHQQATYHVPSAAHIGPGGPPGMLPMSATTAAPLSEQAPGSYYAHGPMIPFADTRNYPGAMHGQSTRAAGHTYAMSPHNAQHLGPQQSAYPLAQPSASSQYGPAALDPHIDHNHPGAIHGHNFATNNGHVMAPRDIEPLGPHQQATYQGPLVPSQGLSAGMAEGSSAPSIDLETSHFDTTGMNFSFDTEAVASDFQRSLDQYHPAAATDSTNII